MNQNGQSSSVIAEMPVSIANADYDWNSVRATGAAPLKTFFMLGNLDQRDHVVCYFENRILKTRNDSGIGVGFSDQKFPVQGGFVGDRNNTVGIYGKGGIWLDGHFISFENGLNGFAENDVVGCGVLYSYSDQCYKCFAACNGTFLGMVNLPPKFNELQFYPTISLAYPSNAIRSNFGKDPFRFNAEQHFGI